MCSAYNVSVCYIVLDFIRMISTGIEATLVDRNLPWYSWEPTNDFSIELSEKMSLVNESDSGTTSLPSCNIFRGKLRKSIGDRMRWVTHEISSNIRRKFGPRRKGISPKTSAESFFYFHPKPFQTTYLDYFYALTWQDNPSTSIGATEFQLTNSL